MTDYEKLTAELDEILAKAQPVEGDADADKKIAAAAEDGQGDGQGDGEDEDAEEFMKSFNVTLESGEKVEAYDATALLKAMHGQSRRQAETIADLQARLAGADAVIQKVPTLLKAMQQQLAEQHDMLKALREQPGGRKSLTQTTSPNQPAKPTRGEVMLKALGAQKAGRLSVHDVSVIEARLNNGIDLDPRHLAAMAG